MAKIVQARSMAIELTAKAYLPRQSMERSADVVLVQSSSPFGNEEKVRGRLALEVLVSTRLVHRQHRSRRTGKGNQATLAKLRATHGQNRGQNPIDEPTLLVERQVSGPTLTPVVW